jgi:GT2 family glycosyltransferase
MAGPNPTRTDVAVIVPVHNGLEYTRLCMQCLAKQTGIQFETVIVDDGSTDGTGAYLRQAHPDVDVVRGDGNLWWSGAINRGAARAIERGAEILILFNNDNIDASPALLRRLTDVVRRTGAWASAVSVSAHDGTRLIVHAGGSLEWSAGRQRLVDADVPYVETSRLEPRDWLPATALAIDSETFTLLDGADQSRFPQYRGDIDLTLRARELGRDCLVVYDAWVVNDQTQTGMNFERRLGPGDVVRGLWTLRSSYNLREAVPFALRHCPRRTVARYLILYYARYFYACGRAMLRSRKQGVHTPPDRQPVIT